MRRYFNSMENLLNECEIINPFGEFLSSEMIVKVLCFFSNFIIRNFEKQTRESKLICDQLKSPTLHINKALSVNIPPCHRHFWGINTGYFSTEKWKWWQKLLARCKIFDSSDLKKLWRYWGSIITTDSNIHEEKLLLGMLSQVFGQSKDHCIISHSCAQVVDLKLCFEIKGFDLRFYGLELSRSRTHDQNFHLLKKRDKWLTESVVINKDLSRLYSRLFLFRGAVALKSAWFHRSGWDYLPPEPLGKY